MDFIKERINTTVEKLRSYFYKERYNVSTFYIKKGNFSSPQHVANSNIPWQPFESGMKWGGRDCHAWFRAELEVPTYFDGEKLALYISTLTQGWDAVNPQFKIYVNGKLLQGIDVNHREVMLPNIGRAGAKYIIDLHAYSGMCNHKVDLYMDFLAVDSKVIGLYYDIKVPLEAVYKLPQDSKQCMDMLKILNDTINIIDFRKPRSKNFYDSIDKARNYIQIEFYKKICGYSTVIATCVGHTHIDVAWQWTVSQTREKAERSFATALKLMEEYPEYIFMSSQPQLYKFIKEDNPELYECMKEAIVSAKWETDGAMWVEADCNIPSGESLVRQILYGTRFLKKEFGIENKILWLPDTFGFNAALPQILKKSHIDYFVTTKLSWNQYNKLPYDTFMWRGIDGTEVLTHFITTMDYSETMLKKTTYNSKLNVSQVMGAWKGYQQKNINNEVLISYGYGDGGGGPTREMLEYAKRLKKGIPGCPKVKLDSVGNFFKRLEKSVTTNKKLPIWVGELYFENHRGTYTSMARNKRDNRKSELLQHDVEFLSYLAEKEIGITYPKKQIDINWEIILRNQFHDIVSGTSIKEVYDVTKTEYKEVLDLTNKMIKTAIDNIVASINLDSHSVVIFNTLSSKRSDLIFIDLSANIETPILLDENQDQIHHCQIINDGDIKKALFFVKDIPAMGYKTFTIKESNTKTIEKNTIIVDIDRMENDFFKIEIDNKGSLSSIYDKRANREIIKENERGNKLLAFEDKPMNYDNWNIEIYYQEKMWEIDEVESIEVVETGPIRGKLRIYKKFVDSTIMQDICIYRDIPRIDFETYVNWKQDQVLLKVEFPLDVLTDKATYEIQYGNIERPTHWNTSWDKARFEVYGHKWADISENGYGVSLLNDSKYGYDIKDSVMRLTLIKAGIFPNSVADIENHYFTYSLYPHMGDWREGATVQMGYNLNVPLYKKLGEPHKGKLPTNLSMVQVDKENIVIETVKRAEDSDDLIVRLYECWNRRTRANLVFYKDIDKVVECSLMEKDLKIVNFENNSFSFEMKPYEIKTFKVRLSV